MSSSKKHTDRQTDTYPKMHNRNAKHRLPPSSETIAIKLQCNVTVLTLVMWLFSPIPTAQAGT
jgi:hypothetical protein